jgi:hypothetical protein
MTSKIQAHLLLSNSEVWLTLPLTSRYVKPTMAMAVADYFLASVRRVSVQSAQLFRLSMRDLRIITNTKCVTYLFDAY